MAARPTLLGIPPELRIPIYDYVLYPSDSAKYAYLASDVRTPAIAQVCRLTRIESLPISPKFRKVNLGELYLGPSKEDGVRGDWSGTSAFDKLKQFTGGRLLPMRDVVFLLVIKISRGQGYFHYVDVTVKMDLALGKVQAIDQRRPYPDYPRVSIDMVDIERITRDVITSVKFTDEDAPSFDRFMLMLKTALTDRYKESRWVRVR